MKSKLAFNRETGPEEKKQGYKETGPRVQKEHGNEGEIKLPEGKAMRSAPYVRIAFPRDRRLKGKSPGNEVGAFHDLFKRKFARLRNGYGTTDPYGS